MAQYRVLVETLGANPTHSKGDIIEDSGAQKSTYDIPWLLRTGAIEKMDDDRAAPASVTASSGPAATRADLPPMSDTSTRASDLLASDLDDDQRTALGDAGIRTAEDVRGASDEQLRSIRGIGPATLTKLREATKV